MFHSSSLLNYPRSGIESRSCVATEHNTDADNKRTRWRGHTPSNDSFPFLRSWEESAIDIRKRGDKPIDCRTLTFLTWSNNIRSNCIATLCITIIRHI